MTIRVLIVDDSALIRSLIGAIVEQQPDMQLVGAAPVSYTHLTLPTTPYV